MDILDKILRLMKERHWSAYQLAKNADISQSTLSNLINRGNIPSLYTMIKICDAFDVTLSQFFAENNVYIELTKEQERLLLNWSYLSKIEKEKVSAYMSGMVDGKGQE